MNKSSFQLMSNQYIIYNFYAKFNKLEAEVKW